MVAEEAKDKVKEKQDWLDRVIVKSTHFKVNTRMTKSHQMNKYKNIRQGEVEKPGLKIFDRAHNRLTGRHISAGRFVSDPPVSMMALGEEFRMNETGH